MEGLRVGIYESFGDISGRRSTYEQLVNFVSAFRRDSVLWMCSHISLVLRMFVANAESSKEYYELVDQYFSPQIAVRFKAGYWAQGAQRLVFHRRQLLLLAKLAILHCENVGKDAGIPADGFGVAFLMANDHLDYGVINDLQMKPPTRQDYAALVTELLSMQEFGGFPRAETIVRAYKMFVEAPLSLQEHPDYIDINQSLEESTGLTYTQIFASTVAYISRYITMKPQDIKNNGRTMVTVSDYLRTIEIPSDKLIKYLETVSGNPTLMREELLQKDAAPTDLSILRKYPLIDRWFDVGTNQQRLGHIPLDIELWWQKVYAGPFWLLSAKHKHKFHRFWGTVFEQYVHSILEPSQQSQGICFVRNPASPIHPTEELCDAAIVAGDNLILVEYKSVLIRADVKYSGNVQHVTSHLKSKFVSDSASDRPKAVLQLASAARILFADDLPTVEWVDLRQIRNCYLLIVTLDSVGEAFAISPFLESYMSEALNRASCRTVTIRPLYCVDIGTIERIRAALYQAPLASILERWYKENPVLSMPLLSMQMKDMLPERPEEMWEEWETIMDIAKDALFDDATIQAGKVSQEALRLKSRREVASRRTNSP